MAGTILVAFSIAAWCAVRITEARRPAAFALVERFAVTERVLAGHGSKNAVDPRTFRSGLICGRCRVSEFGILIGNRMRS